MPAKLDKIVSMGTNELAEYVGNLTPQKAFGGQMSEFRKDNGPELFESIEKLIATTVMGLNIKFNLGVNQIPPLARAIYSKYYFYSLDEIGLIFRMGRQGELGPLMHKLDEETVMDWFKTYDLEYREALVINARTQLNNKYERENASVVIEALGGDALVSRFVNKIKEEKETKEQILARLRVERVKNEAINLQAIGVHYLKTNNCESEFYKALAQLTPESKSKRK